MIGSGISWRGRKKKRKNLQALIITKFFIQSYKNMIQCSKSILKVLNYLHFSVEKWNCTHNLILLKKKKKKKMHNPPTPKTTNQITKMPTKIWRGLCFYPLPCFLWSNTSVPCEKVTTSSPTCL